MRRRLAVLAIALVFASPACNRSGDGTPAHWEAGPDLPEPLQDMQATTAGDFMYVAGGHDSAGAISDRVYRLRDGDSAWERVSNLPAPRYRMAVMGSGDAVFAFGGYGPGDTATATTWIFLPNQNTWITAPSMPRPRAGGVALGYALTVLVGGVTSGDVPADSFDLLDVSRLTWWRGDALPAPLALAASGGAFDMFITAGGVSGGAASAAAYGFALLLNQWTPLEPMPAPRSDAVAGGDWSGTRIHVFGGIDGGVVNTHYYFDTQLRSWGELPPVPTARRGMALARTTSFIGAAFRHYLIGGSTKPGFGPSRVVEIWVEPPPSID